MQLQNRGTKKKKKKRIDTIGSVLLGFTDTSSNSAYYGVELTQINMNILTIEIVNFKKRDNFLNLYEYSINL